ncbi:MAG: hypothetical protein B7Y58_04940 [Halothiobacillus sp. 35-54-62]|jgi:hypothetical protein|nr:MAG: hypothetical protein B7Y58_04940 [Halothiobacillus sp. 35-54-62]
MVGKLLYLLVCVTQNSAQVGIVVGQTFRRFSVLAAVLIQHLAQGDEFINFANEGICYQNWLRLLAGLSGGSDRVGWCG